MKTLIISAILSKGRVKGKDVLGREYVVSTSIIVSVGDAVVIVGGAVVNKIRKPAPTIYFV